MRRFSLALLLFLFSFGAVSASLKEKLHARIDALDAAFDGVVAVAILDLESGEVISRRADLVLPTASTIKIGILAEVLRQAEAGAIDLDTVYALDPRDGVGGSGVLAGMKPGTRRTLRELATLMIVESDNTATNVLLDRVGLDSVNTLFERLALRETRIRRKMMDSAARREGRENTATAGELVRLLAAIHRGEACGAKCTRDTIRILALPKQSPLRRALPPSVRAASKGGSLEGIRVDAGIVFARRHPFAIAVMTSQASNENAAEETIESITRAAYEYFDRLARASRHGRLNE